jgi:hypothetical protein
MSVLRSDCAGSVSCPRTPRRPFCHAAVGSSISWIRPTGRPSVTHSLDVNTQEMPWPARKRLSSSGKAYTMDGGRWLTTSTLTGRRSSWQWRTRRRPTSFAPSAIASERRSRWQHLGMGTSRSPMRWASAKRRWQCRCDGPGKRLAFAVAQSWCAHSNSSWRDVNELAREGIVNRASSRSPGLSLHRYRWSTVCGPPVQAPAASGQRTHRRRA